MTTTAQLTGQDIGEADGALTAVLERALAPTGRSRVDYLTLRVVAGRGPYPSEAELTDYLAGQPQLGLTRDQVAAVLDRLRADDLITDGAPVELTAAGRDLLQRLAAAVVPDTRRIFAGLDPADLATAHRVLVELTERARTLLSTPTR